MGFLENGRRIEPEEVEKFLKGELNYLERLFGLPKEIDDVYKRCAGIQTRTP